MNINIKVGHLTYTVEYANKEQMDADNKYGDCNHRREVIRLSRDMSVGRETEVLIHEIMHAICHVYGYNDDMKEEDTVTCISKGFAQVLMDNPFLVLKLDGQERRDAEHDKYQMEQIAKRRLDRDQPVELTVNEKARAQAEAMKGAAS